MIKNLKDYNTWIEISKNAYKNNIAFVRSNLADGVMMAAVIKANGYGHGMLNMAQLAQENNINIFCVHSIDEAIILRKNNFQQKIILLGPVPLKRISQVIDHNLSIVLYNMEHLRALIALKKKIKIHLKLEVGTNRQGVGKDELLAILQTIPKNDLIVIEGAYGHLANVEDTSDHTYAQKQFEEYLNLFKIFEEFNISNIIKHLSSSAASLVFKKAQFDMIRLGIVQYGLWPSKETLISLKHHDQQIKRLTLTPILCWKTRISQIKNVSKNQYVGYGCTFQTSRNSKLAVLPIGYSDGLDRGLSNKGHVLVSGMRAPIIGRVAMNITMIDITDIQNVKLEDEVVIIGRQGEKIIFPSDLAQLTNTINYEIVARLPSHLPRILV